MKPPQRSLHPAMIKSYSLLRPIVKTQHHKYLLGVYTSNAQKYFVKTWIGNVKNIDYYDLTHEYIISDILSNKPTYTDPISGYRFHVRKPVEYIFGATGMSAVFEYIEGKPLSKYAQATQAAVLAGAVAALEHTTDSITPEERAYIPTRNSLLYILSIPLLLCSSLVFAPRKAMQSVKLAMDAFSHAFRINVPLKLEHRDLSAENILLIGKDTYIIDCSSVALTLPGYDIAQLLVRASWKPYASTFLVTPYATLDFLQPYIALLLAAIGEPMI